MRGKESDGVASAGKLFYIVPYKMKGIYISFRATRYRIDSYNVKASTESAVCEGVLHPIPDVIGPNEL